MTRVEVASVVKEQGTADLCGAVRLRCWAVRLRFGADDWRCAVR
jgi:hypothetical protein